MFPTFTLVPGMTASVQSLRSFCLFNVDTDIDELANFLALCSQLETLKIFASRVSANDILESLTWNDERRTGPRLPSLKEFAFAFSPEDAEDEELGSVGIDFCDLKAEIKGTGAAEGKAKPSSGMRVVLDVIDNHLLAEEFGLKERVGAE
ncbi:hypothetical protein DXG03_008362 [Asterophora parasitica]|uniref:Uncharacterized protein n=1 Tax=Asterophora parasitica TaxID=117018 RepID=A0A9P7G5J1_9AGAR|nr:hypothetical protein DXG03_008362 [Asterophora parasitica]